MPVQGLFLFLVFLRAMLGVEVLPHWFTFRQTSRSGKTERSHEETQTDRPMFNGKAFEHRKICKGSHGLSVQTSCRSPTLSPNFISAFPQGVMARSLLQLSKPSSCQSRVKTLSHRSGGVRKTPLGPPWAKIILSADKLRAQSLLQVTRLGPHPIRPLLQQSFG